MTDDWDWDADHPDNEGVFYDEEGQKFRPGSPAWKKRLNMIRNKLGLPDLPPEPEFDTPEDKLIHDEGGPEKVYPSEFSGLPTLRDMLEGKEAGHDLLTTGEPMAFDRAWNIAKSRDWRIDGKEELEDLLFDEWDDYKVHPSSPKSLEGSWREAKPRGNWVWKRPLLDQPRKTGYSPESLHLDTLPAWILYQSGYPIMPELSQENTGYGFPPAAVQPRGRQIAPVTDHVRYLQTGDHPEDDKLDAWTGWLASGGQDDVPLDLQYLLSPYYRDITAPNIADFSQNPFIGDKKHDEYLFDAMQAFDPFDGLDPIEEALGRADDILETLPGGSDAPGRHNHSEVIDRINENMGRLRGDEMKIDDVTTLESMRRVAEGLEDEGY